MTADSQESAVARPCLLVVDGDAAQPRHHDFAAFVGAARLLDARGGVQSLVEDVCGRTLHAAG